LVLDNSSKFSGEIFGFTGLGTQATSDQIDLKDVNYDSHTTNFSYDDTQKVSTLTVGDGSHTATLEFNGQYSEGNFQFADDGSPQHGTIVYDPPVTPSAATTTQPNQTLTDSSDNQSVAVKLVGDYSTSTWTVSDDHHSGANIVDPPAASSAATTIATTQPNQTLTDSSDSKSVGTATPTVSDDHHSGANIVDPPVASSSATTITTTQSNQTLTGTGGNDNFVFTPSFGNATIADNTLGADTIQVDHSTVATVQALLATATQSGNDVPLPADAHDTITPTGVTVTAVQSHQSDFHIT
jgi:hypothetical protein